MFKQTVHTWLYGETELSEIARRLRAVGADGFELCFQNEGMYTPENLEKSDILRVLEDYGLKTPSMTALFTAEMLDLSHPDSSVRKYAMDFTKRCIDITARIGCDRLQITPSRIYSNHGYHTSREDDWSRSVDSIRNLCEYAADSPVMLMIEPINRFRVALVRTIEEALNMIHDIDLPNIHIAADVYHMHMEESRGIAQAIRDANVHLKCLHLGDNTRYPPGYGTIDWKPIIHALRDIGFEGPLAHEPMSIDFSPQRLCNDKEYAEVFDEKLRFGIAYLRSVMQLC